MLRLKMTTSSRQVVGGWLVASLFMLGLLAVAARADDYTSPSFIVRDPVISLEGGRSSSGSFELITSSGQLLTAETTSGTFIHRAGFLYFPVATTPALAASPGSAQVSLSWTASVGTLANITTYEVGTATVSGGPYTFADVGSVLAFVKTGLTNGTPYFFVVKALAGTLLLAQSTEATATPTGAAPPGGGGGGGGSYSPGTSVSFSGLAYPLSPVTLLKDGQIIATTTAQANAAFTVAAVNLTAGTYNFALYAQDSAGRRSRPVTFPLTLTQGSPTSLTGLVLPPTLASNLAEVKRGDTVTLFGASAPGAQVTLFLAGEQGYTAITQADTQGAYVYAAGTGNLTLGEYQVTAKSAVSSVISNLSFPVRFLVGSTSVPAELTACPTRADLNGDCRVDLVDFSILIYWFPRSSPPAKVDLSGDGKVDLIDFSILVFYWTG